MLFKIYVYIIFPFPFTFNFGVYIFKVPKNLLKTEIIKILFYFNLFPCYMKISFSSNNLPFRVLIYFKRDVLYTKLDLRVQSNLPRSWHMGAFIFLWLSPFHDICSLGWVPQFYGKRFEFFLWSESYHRSTLQNTNCNILHWLPACCYHL